MVQIRVGDEVVVAGLINQTRYNGCQGVVTKLVYSEPEDKCEIRLAIDPEGPRPLKEKEEKRIILKMRCVRPVAGLQLQRRASGAPGPEPREPCPEPPLRQPRAFTALAPPPPSAGQSSTEYLNHSPIRTMLWGSADQKAFEQVWVQRIAVQDCAWLERAKRDVWMYLILKLAELLRINNKVGTVAWSFHKQVKHLHYGYVWAHGGREQRQPLSANVMEDGHQWWPVIWVEMDGVLKPVYCPGLAWMGARPWEAHSSRMAEVDKPQFVIDSVDDECPIVDVTDRRVSVRDGQTP